MLTHEGLETLEYNRSSFLLTGSEAWRTGCYRWRSEHSTRRRWRCGATGFLGTEGEQWAARRRGGWRRAELKWIRRHCWCRGGGLTGSTEVKRRFLGAARSLICQINGAVYYIIAHRNLLDQNKPIGLKQFTTRKTSCVNARGIPPARGRKMLTPPPPAGWTWPPPHRRLDLTPPPVSSLTWPPPCWLDLTPPAGPVPPPQVWTDKQSETITFPSYYVRGR